MASKITHIIPSMILALASVKLDADGKIVKGWVVNGEWSLVRRNGEWLAKDGYCIANRWPCKPEDDTFILCPPELAHDYNRALHETFPRENLW